MQAIRGSQVFYTPLRNKAGLAFHPDRKANNQDTIRFTTTGPASNTKAGPPESVSSCHAKKTEFHCFPKSRNFERAKAKSSHFLAYVHQHPQQESSVQVIDQNNPVHFDDEATEGAKLSLDVTGFAPRDISIEVDDVDHIVSISGKRTNKLGDIFCLNRRFRLDKTTADQDRLSATIEDGILEIVVPKKKTAGPRRIPIRSSAAPATSILETIRTPDSKQDEDGDTAAVEQSNEAVLPHVGENAEIDTPDEQKQHELDSVEVETIQEGDDNDDEDDNEYEEEDEEEEEQQEEETKSSAIAATTTSETPSSSAIDEGSWMMDLLV